MTIFVCLFVCLLSNNHYNNDKEVDVFRFLGRHPNVVTFFGVSYNEMNDKYNKTRYLITEWAPRNSLDTVIEKRANNQNCCR